MKEHEITDKTLITYLTRLKGFCGIVWYDLCLRISSDSSETVPVTTGTNYT